MDDYVFEDVLAGSTLTCTFPHLAVSVSGDGQPRQTRSLFFPGCSLINYGLPLVNSVYDLLRNAGRVEGISLLCCGKILSFEPDSAQVRQAFEEQLRDHIATAGVERIVAACPNCVLALRSALSQDTRTANVVVASLPAELVDLGYRVDSEVAQRMLSHELTGTKAVVDGEASLRLSVHDSCPDRETGEFAEGLRTLLGTDLFVDPAHCKKRSQCCGSLVRAAGKFDAASKQAQQRAAEAVEAGAVAMVTACVSCSYLLSASQQCVPVFHYLELLYDWRIDWQHASQYMKLRFLFDEAGTAEEIADAARPFVGLKPPSESEAQ